MKQRIIIVLLALGTVAGFGSGLAHLRHHRDHARAHLLDRVAEECVAAARRLDDRPPEGRASPDRRPECPESR